MNLNDYRTEPEQEFSIVRDVLNWGHSVNSRYGPCSEIFSGRQEFTPRELVTRKGINWSLGWMEMLQLIAGVFDPEAIMRVAPKANQSLFTYKMAYGPRAMPYIPSLIQTLENDPLSRQAVLFIGHIEDGFTSDLPCTLSMQFLIRGGCIHAVVSMRSWDLCRGLPYDIMMFQGLQEVVGRIMGIPTGVLIVNAGSAHIYNDQVDKLPYRSSKRWVFEDDAPTTWQDFRGWAWNNVKNLQRRETPGCIRIDG